MEKIVLKASKRKIIGKQVRALRREGFLPAVVFGSFIDPLPIAFNLKEVNRVISGASTSQLIELEVEAEKYTTLLREKQRHPVTGSLLHVDFQAVSLTEKLKTMVDIELVGESPAVKIYGGILVTGQEELEVECLPGDLPSRVTIDISSLENIGDAIYIRDVKIPGAVEILTNPGEIIVIVAAPEIEAEAVIEEPSIEPEVIERGKKEEEF